MTTEVDVESLYRMFVKKSIPACEPHACCNNQDLVHVKTEIVCCNCGIVDDIDNIVSDQNGFNFDDPGSIHDIRVGMVIDKNFPCLSMRTIVGGTCPLSRRHVQSNITPIKEIRLFGIKKELNDYVILLSLNENIKTTALNIYIAISKKEEYKIHHGGFIRQAILVCCIYTACIYEKNFININTLSKKCFIDMNKLMKGYVILLDLLKKSNLPLIQFTIYENVDRVFNELDLIDYKMNKFVKDIISCLKKSREFTNSKDRMLIVSVLIFINHDTGLDIFDIDKVCCIFDIKSTSCGELVRAIKRNKSHIFSYIRKTR